MERPSLAPVVFAIIFVGIVISISLYFALRPQAEPTVGIGGRTITVAPVTAEDHILGDPNAPIKIIEYSDLECEFCRRFHVTMKKIMGVYGADGTVAWVYRHFPFVELHENAPRLAEASECVAELGGNDAFWKFVDKVFTAPSLNGKFDMSRLSATAAIAGVPVQEFETCLASGRYKEKVARHFAEARAAGGEGSPHNIVIAADTAPIPVPGAQPYATIQSIIEALLAPAR